MTVASFELISAFTPRLADELSVTSVFAHARSLLFPISLLFVSPAKRTFPKLCLRNMSIIILNEYQTNVIADSKT